MMSPHSFQPVRRRTSRLRAVGIRVGVAALAAVVSTCAPAGVDPAPELVSSTGKAATPHASEPAGVDALAATSGWRLESVVIVSRHGVRSPTRTKPPLVELTARPWPAWPVAPGELTPRGESMIRAMGTWYGDWFRQQHLLPGRATCPSAGHVAAWADVDQRTRVTADALLEGIAPGCGLHGAHQADLDRDDPLFHAAESGQCRLDPKAVHAAIAARLGPDGEAALQRRYAVSLARMNDVLDFQSSTRCKNSAGDVCSLATLPTRVQINETGRHIRLDGPLGIASTVSEVFLLEYAQGMPAEEVAWGRIRDRDDWDTLLAAHNAQFDLIAKTPAVAIRKGTPLLADVVGALTAGTGEPAAFPTHAPADARVYLLGAHDTNLANLAGMLALEWSLPDQPDHTPPGAGLVFARWLDPASRTRYVTLELDYASLAQLRNASPLSATVPPSRMPLRIAGCDDPARPGACRLDAFTALVRSRVAPDCLSAR
ncbi:histidine-type phosphatase [Burkholderia cenocepacia]|uniref:histidine-type phosphatase n=1 Tax=Burkholderia cenocepacia TaxID=95486 RepID=UPI0020A066BB|nr:histidine-type phosphatase [Burkholderia cenocepacia]MCO8327239.1 histidine-type phosphatase [Burkholderia cenocepacia]MCO8334488.1 histidine-type phosphatase [Burkholderia cenocepacia]MCO8341770.1 histidine-type phosphatase [Burkholderia cenocepacia]MCO8349095.1 histidine-type phosphatase [Burkholderia cenocepacia]MCO8362379.1 histidine-type phosphatase [Burkholderia cenocepacia]